MRTRLILGVLALAVSIPLMADGQTRATTADLVGVVTDATNAVLPGATVTATNVETNLSRSTTSEGNGRFSIPALRPGTYRVVVALSGFAEEVRESVTLALGSRVEVDGVTGIVTVLESAALAAHSTEPHDMAIDPWGARSHDAAS